MTRFMTASAALLASTALAHAGGLDRSGLGISALFEDGNYVELSYGQVMPSVTGSVGPAESGEMARDYTNYSFSYRTDLADGIGLLVQYEQAYGASIEYLDIAYPLNAALTTTFDAELTGTALTAVLSYDLDDNWIVYAGLRQVTMSAEINFFDIGPGQTVTYADDSDLGYLFGVAYEIPEIALRGSITYNSATTHENAIDSTLGPVQDIGPGAATTGEYTMPQSVNIDFQTGIAEGTLLLASIRWAEWTETVIPTTTALGTIDHDNDVFTYGIGVARRFTDDFAAVARVSYEQAQGGLASNLAPTDGLLGLSLAGIYTIGDLDITAGVNYTHVGDATTENPLGPGEFADFSGNHVFGAGVRFGYSF